MDNKVTTEWYAHEQLLITRLQGKITGNDVRRWQDSLQAVIETIPDNTKFKILVDLYGFEAENTEVHKEYRSIIPLLLADYGYRIGYLDMFPEATIELKSKRGIQCVAMANVHHNADKMLDYETRFSKLHEHYFTDPDAALQWIKSVTVER